MSHAGACRTLAMLVVATSLACNPSSPNNNVAVLGSPQSVSPIHVNFTCGAIDSLALVDANGTPAWTFITKKNDTISWVVPSNVTINSITGKTAADTLPLVSNGPQGGQPGVSFDSKVQNSNKSETKYHYNIDATCHPQTGSDVHLLIDPEMIVR